jgi:hypothetical protein
MHIILNKFKIQLKCYLLNPTDLMSKSLCTVVASVKTGPLDLEYPLGELEISSLSPSPTGKRPNQHLTELKAE